MPADNFLEGGGDWVRYQEFVVHELKRHGAALESITEQVRKLSQAVAVNSREGDDIRDIREALTKVREKVAALEVRCGIFGAIAGTGAYLLVHLLRALKV